MADCSDIEFCCYDFWVVILVLSFNQNFAYFHSKQYKQCGWSHSGGTTPSVKRRALAKEFLSPWGQASNGCLCRWNDRACNDPGLCEVIERSDIFRHASDWSLSPERWWVLFCELGRCEAGARTRPQWCTLMENQVWNKWFKWVYCCWLPFLMAPPIKKALLFLLPDPRMVV